MILVLTINEARVVHRLATLRTASGIIPPRPHTTLPPDPLDTRSNEACWLPVYYLVRALSLVVRL